MWKKFGISAQNSHNSFEFMSTTDGLLALNIWKVEWNYNIDISENDVDKYINLSPKQRYVLLEISIFLFNLKKKFSIYSDNSGIYI